MKIRLSGILFARISFGSPRILHTQTCTCADKDDLINRYDYDKIAAQSYTDERKTLEDAAKNDPAKSGPAHQDSPQRSQLTVSSDGERHVRTDDGSGTFNLYDYVKRDTFKASKSKRVYLDTRRITAGMTAAFGGYPDLVLSLAFRRHPASFSGRPRPLVAVHEDRCGGYGGVLREQGEHGRAIQSLLAVDEAVALHVVLSSED